MPYTTPTPSDDTIDSRDIISHIEYLEDAVEGGDATTDERDELATLRALAEECEGCADWHYGEMLIAKTCFVEYIKEVINECYPMPEDFDNGSWPWCHLNMNWESAAKDAEMDYMEVEYDGVPFLIRCV